MKFKDLETKDTKKLEVKESKLFLESLEGYQIIGQGCDVCNDVEMHAFNKKAKIIMCLNCKTTKQLK
jgi:hypothetical protein